MVRQEAWTWKMLELRARLVDLHTQKNFKAMSDDRAFSNGSLDGFDKEIAEVRGKIATWYSANPFWFTAGDDVKLGVTYMPHMNGSMSFEMTTLGHGVIKRMAVVATPDELQNLAAYIGGRQVVYLGQTMDSVAAYNHVLPKLNAEIAKNQRLEAEIKKLKKDLENESGLRAED